MTGLVKTKGLLLAGVYGKFCATATEDFSNLHFYVNNNINNDKDKKAKAHALKIIILLNFQNSSNPTNK
jgi:hypothetical protein